jgi:C4-dicarboxylate-binding protein DctP
MLPALPVRQHSNWRKKTMFRKITTLVATAALSAMLMTGSALANDPIKIKFAHVVAENTPKGQMAIKFKEMVAERLGGKVVVEVFPSSQLFGDNKVLEAMILGDVQMAAPALSKFDRYTHQLQIFDLPFLFKDMAAVEKFQKSEKGQELLKTIEKKGLIGLGYLHNGLKQMSANKPLIVPADAKGLKFRIMTSDVLAAQFQAIDAVPLKKPFSEVFTLLQTKAIDGQENTYSNNFSQKFFEIQSHITETNHGLLDYMVVTSKEFWMSVPEDIRPELKAIIDEAIVYGNKVALEKDLEDKQQIIDSKRTTIVEISEADRALWVEAMKPVWAKFEKEIGKDMIDAAYQSNM